VMEGAGYRAAAARLATEMLSAGGAAEAAARIDAALSTPD
jgi:hypothetical protein